MNSGILYIVATPIGNLNDITLRALNTLREVDLIAAEDTRHSRRLLQEHGIEKTMLSVHEHNERQQIDTVIERLLAGLSIALISDAGTPLISDPGFPLVRAVRAAGLKVVPIPGACAAITALSASGIAADHFIFEGFLPAKSQARCNRLQALLNESRTLIFYESVHRIQDSLQDMLTVFGGKRRIVLARELTKTYETFLDGNLADVLQQVTVDPNQQKGEFVLIVEGAVIAADEQVSPAAKRVVKLLMDDLPLKQSVELAAKITECSKNFLYDYALSLRTQESE